MPSSWPARPPGAPAWDAQDARGVGAGVPRAGRPAAVCRSRLCEHCGHAALSRPAWRQRPKLQRPAAAGTGRRAGARTRREQQPPQLAPHAQDRRNRQAAHAQAQLQPEAQRAEVARAVRLPRGARAPSAVRAPPETAPREGGGVRFVQVQEVAEREEARGRRAPAGLVPGPRGRAAWPRAAGGPCLRAERLQALREADGHGGGRDVVQRQRQHGLPERGRAQVPRERQADERGAERQRGLQRDRPAQPQQPADTARSALVSSGGQHW